MPSSLSLGISTAFALLEEELKRVEMTLRESAATAAREGQLDQASSYLNKIRGVQAGKGPIGVCLHKLLTTLAEDTGSNAEDSETVRQRESDRACPPAVQPHRDMRRMHYNGTNAYAQMTPSGYRLCAGSTVRRPKHSSLAEPWRQFRDRCEADGTLAPADSPEFLILTKDVEFPSPSAAAQFVAGCAVSGPREWRATRMN